MGQLDGRYGQGDNFDGNRAALNALPVAEISRTLSPEAAERLAQIEAKQIEYAAGLVLKIGDRTATLREHLGDPFVRLLAEVGPKPVYRQTWQQINPWSKDEARFHSRLGAGSYYGQYVIALTPSGISLSIDINRRDFTPAELVERLNHAVLEASPQTEKVTLTLTTSDWENQRNIGAPMKASIALPYRLESLQIIKALFSPELHGVPGHHYNPDGSVMRRCNDLMADVLRSNKPSWEQRLETEIQIELPIAGRGSGLAVKLP